MRIRLCIVLLLLFAAPVQAADINLVINILECESSGKHDAVGDGGIAYGIAQFHKDTFYEFAALMGMQPADWHNSIHQLRVMNWALDHGYGGRWSCYRKLMKKEKRHAIK